MASQDKDMPSGRGHDHAYSGPLTDEKMRKLIDNKFTEVGPFYTRGANEADLDFLQDAIYDFHIDHLLEKSLQITPYNYVDHILRDNLPDKRFKSEEHRIKALRHKCLESINKKLKEHKLSECHGIPMNRVEKRYKLLPVAEPNSSNDDSSDDGSDGKVPKYADDFLDAAVEVLEKSVSPFDSSYTRWPDLPSTGKPSLQHNAQVGLLDRIQTAISAKKAAATYACGGKVLRVASPVTIRWGCLPPECGLVTFPVAPELSRKEETSLESLFRHCPRTPGRRDVGELDQTQFCTNFCPHESGIVDAVAQFLLPSLPLPSLDVEDVCRENLDVSAKLDRLYVRGLDGSNVGLCGESVSQGLGPLDPTHFATLVIHLPSPHQGTSVLFGQYSITQPASADADWAAKGGALVVRYDGHDLVFSNDSTDSLTIGQPSTATASMNFKLCKAAITLL